MLSHANNIYSLVDFAFQHPFDDIQASVFFIVKGYERHSQWMVQNLINVVEGVLLVHDSV